MEGRVIKSGNGWRMGYNAETVEYQALLGTDDWAVELTAAEFNDFCRLSHQLVDTLKAIASELMDEEKISLEAESDLVWVELAGYPQDYCLRFIITTGRAAEGKFSNIVVKELLPATTTLQVF